MSSNSVNDYRVFSSMAYASKSKIMYDEGSLSMPIYSDGDYYNAGGSSLVRNPLGYAFDKVVLGNSDNNHIETEYKHKTPVTFGMSLRFYLDEKWAVETCYTFPGAIQYYGPSSVCDITTRTLALEKGE